MATTFMPILSSQTPILSSQTPIKSASPAPLIQIRNYIYSASDFLGSGNFSIVYAGTNITTKERVAIKIIELKSLNTDKLQ